MVARSRRFVCVVPLAFAALLITAKMASADSYDGAVHYQLTDALDAPAPTTRLVSLFQQPPMDNATPMPMEPMTEPVTRRRPLSLLDRATGRLARSARRRTTPLTRAPHMFGDWFTIGTAFHDTGLVVGGVVNTSIPLSGGARRAKASENNSALTKDRCWVAYNHFHNAGRVQRFDGGTLIGYRGEHNDRFTVGLERTICDGDWSVELRMPFSRRFEVADADLDIDGGSIGDLSIFIKHMLRQQENMVISAGLGINTPTGSAVKAYMPLIDTGYELRSSALTLAPFIAVMGVAHEIWFYHGFMQVDIPTGGNEWRVDEAGSVTTRYLQDQTLLQMDGTLGVWLHQGNYIPHVTAVALLMELHYTASLSDDDSVIAPAGDTALYTHLGNRYDIVNATTALHFELGPTCDLRVGIVAPLDEFERFFDSEMAVQVNKHY